MTRLDFWLGLLIILAAVRAMFYEHRRGDERRHKEVLLGIRGSVAVGSSAHTGLSDLRGRVEKLEEWKKTVEGHPHEHRRAGDSP